MENRITSVDPGSLLEGDAKPGDRLIAINGREVEDVLDYKFFSYDPEISVTLESPDGIRTTVSLEKEEGEDLGLNFETYLMDQPRCCANRCIFCFVDQLPKGMRKTMYFKDDDARLSFLLGNYITLTNLSEREIRRIMELHISPINISVHTTNPELRVRMLRNQRAGECFPLMRRFSEADIRMNCQIVCCPGWNDGKELERTLQDLKSLWPAVHSVSVVPVGLTRFRKGLEKLTPFSPEHALATIRQVERFAEQCRKDCGTHLVFCSDEFYLKAGIPLPPDEYYEEHTQLENGVGMIRLLESEFHTALETADPPDGKPFSIVCGEAAAASMRGLLEAAERRFPMLQGTLYPIRNDFFGGGVNVTGLVTGGDLIRQLQGKELGTRLLISETMIRRQERDFLDDITVEQVRQALGVPVIPVEPDGFELCDAMFGILPAEKPPRKSFEEAEYYSYNPPAEKA